MKKYSRIICLSSDTLISTLWETKAISTIQPGAEIVSLDLNSGLPVMERVGNVVHSLHNQCAVIGFRNGRQLKMTLDHPVYVVGKGWCSVNEEQNEFLYGENVKRLVIGDKCLSCSNGLLEEIEIVTIDICPCSEEFYCLSTEKSHAFLANGILAHDVDLKLLSWEFLESEQVAVL